MRAREESLSVRLPACRPNLQGGDWDSLARFVFEHGNCEDEGFFYRYLLSTQGKEGIRIGQSVRRVRVARTSRWEKKKRDANVSEFKEGKELSTFCDAPRGMESASAAVVPNSFECETSI